MNNATVSPSVRLGHSEYEISNLSEFGFAIPNPHDALELESLNQATLVLGNEELPIEFKVRRRGLFVKCSFWKLPLGSQQKVIRFLAKQERIGSGNEQLENRSYDELASGLTTTPTESTSGDSTDSAIPAGTSKIKSLAVLLLLLGMLGIGILAAAFLKTRNSLGVANSALVGNYLPVNVRVPGEIMEVLVSEGDFVKKGDVLIRMENQQLEFDQRTYMAERDAAEEKVAALKIQLETFKVKLKIAAKKLDLDQKVAKSQMVQAEKIYGMQMANLQRLTPARQSGAITALEYVEAQNAVAAAQADMNSAEAAILSTQLAKDAVASEVLILGNRVDDQMGQLQSALSVAQAELKQYETLSELAQLQTNQLEVVAPRDGQVYANYRQVGEFLKEADQALAISYPGKVWAAGQVSASQAARVRPGQKVTVSIPSMEMQLQGKVAAVGHRSVYSKGHYNADFRGESATDVPIKVTVDELPEGIPSGIRLDMAITTGFGIKWLDNALGNTIERPMPPKRDEPTIEGPIDSIADNDANVILVKKENIKKAASKELLREVSK